MAKKIGLDTFVKTLINTHIVHTIPEIPENRQKYLIVLHESAIDSLHGTPDQLLGDLADNDYRIVYVLERDQDLGRIRPSIEKKLLGVHLERDVLKDPGTFLAFIQNILKT